MSRTFVLRIALIAWFALTWQAVAFARIVPESQQQLTLSYAPIVKQVTPAVVNIYTSKRVQVRAPLSPFANDPFFGQFFRNFGGMQFGRQREKVVNSLGSGVLIRPDGLLVTNHHVIKDADEIKIVMHDRREFAAELVLADPKTDIALLYIKEKGLKLPYLEMRRADKVEVGDLVLVVGNPFGVGQTVTSGIISATARTTVGISDYQFFLQTDAAINPGNSGGAMVDMHGKLVGVPTAIYSKSGGSVGVGFAIPSNMVMSVVESYEKGGKVIRPWLGVTSVDVTQDIAHSLGMERPYGALVQDLYLEGAAAKAGLKQGDVILQMNGEDIPDAQTLRYKIATAEVGSTQRFTLLRRGKTKELKMKMEGAPKHIDYALIELEGDHPLNGVTVGNLSPALSDELGLRTYKGVAVVEAPNAGPALRMGVKKGDIIESVNQEPVSNTKQLRRIMLRDFTSWQIVILRGNQRLSLRVNM